MQDQERMIELTTTHLAALFSEVTGKKDIIEDALMPFGELGIDSFYVLKIVKRLEQDFGPLPKTLLFQYFNLAELAKYFVNKYATVLSVKFAEHQPAAERLPIEVPVAPPPSTVPIQASVQVPATQQPAQPQQLRTAEKLEKTSSAVLMDEKAWSANCVMPLNQVSFYQHSMHHPVLQKLYQAYKNESSVSRGTRVIAPLVFLGAAQDFYFNFNIHQKLCLGYSYTGPLEHFADACTEFAAYCSTQGWQLNLLTDREVLVVGQQRYSATPFGAVQRVMDLQSFSIEGGKMRRLRYLVSKFEKSGVARTEEFKVGSDPFISASIAAIIERWCQGKAKVNPLVDTAKAEILAGTFAAEHRIFLTYLDDVMQNVIIISPIAAEQGYLMDLEFYPVEMPLGGLEFAIAQIINIVAAEGANIFSLGATFGPKIAEATAPDPVVDQVLDALRQQGMFSDEGNLQFKNKFRPLNESIYLCRPVDGADSDDIIDIIMMIAEPERFAPAGLPEFAGGVVETSPAPLPMQHSVQIEGCAVDLTKSLPGELGARFDLLSQHGFNPMKLAAEHIEHDLKTDSWAQLTLPAISRQLSYLSARLHQSPGAEQALQAIFPFPHLLLTSSGRQAEQFLFAGLQSQTKGPDSIQNLLFVTSIFHQIDHGFTPLEYPDPVAMADDEDTLFKGGLDLAAVEARLQQAPDSVAFICVELSNNAVGGYPVSLAQLRQLKTMVTAYKRPLLLDVTRIIENAILIKEYEPEFKEASIWQIIHHICACADGVWGSLGKDFCIDKGGFIATHDQKLSTQIAALMAEHSVGLDFIDKKQIGLAVQDKKSIEKQVLRRMSRVSRLQAALAAAKLPVLSPAGGHAVIIDVGRIAAFAQLKLPVPAFLSWLYLTTGIRATAQNAGMQKGTALNQRVRLAVPIGLDEASMQAITSKLLQAWRRLTFIPHLTSVLAQGSGIDVDYQLIEGLHWAAEPAQVPKTAAPVSAAAPLSTQPTEASGDSTLTAEPSLNLQGATPSQLVLAEVVEHEMDIVTMITNTNTPSDTSNDRRQQDDIAIVGLAGRYPKATNIGLFWQNLVNGEDCISEISAQRLEKRSKNTFSRAYRAGFIEDIDKFDSLFFSIAPREAEMLDPQERLVLETSWEAIEDAGYYPENLTKEGAPRNIGVYVGAVWSMYQMLGPEQKLAGQNINPNSFMWSIANRVSFFMNLTGPSMTIDTACSSSLTAVYLACQAIRQGNIQAALVGGVNLDLHQAKQDINVSSGALSKDGVCRAFGQGANGYVPGEGVGMMYVKLRSDAERDGDHIYGLIKSAAVNHGGRSSGYTVPKPQSQRDLVLSALAQAGLSAQQLDYIEAHGTGTELGDPIEVTGLTEAFHEHQVQNGTVPMGSVKTNIGHLEAAAGIAGISKVLLQFKHQMLVPSLHSTQLNEHIDFNNSPFYVLQQGQAWQPKQVNGQLQPLRAGISSFGAGGANAHVILEQYLPTKAEHAVTEVKPLQDALVIPLSARSEAQLLVMATRLYDCLTQDQVNPTGSRFQLTDIAYTLQFGRKSFEHRVAFVVKSIEQLIVKLTAFIRQQRDDAVIIGHAANAKEVTKLFNQQEKSEFINVLCKRRDPFKLAQLWTDGLIGDWYGVQAAASGRRISLPTYPFADKRHWAAAQPYAVSEGTKAALHPLIDENVSTFERQLFKKTFQPSDFCIYDHLVDQVPTLPGVAYLDLVRKAGELAAGHKVQRVCNILWVSPITVVDNQPLEVWVELKPGKGAVDFEVFSMRQGQQHLHSQGKIQYATAEELKAADEFIDIAAVRQRVQKVTEGRLAYPLFNKLGLGLGPSFQVVGEVFKHQQEVLATLQLAPERYDSFEQFVLHPTLVDGSLQAAMAAHLHEAADEMFVPFTIKEVEVLHPLPARCYSYVTAVRDEQPKKVSRLNLHIIDERGKILVKIKESIGVPLHDVHSQHGKPELMVAPQKVHAEPLHYGIQWCQVGKETVAATPLQILVFDHNDQFATALRAQGHQVCLVTPGQGWQQHHHQHFTVSPEIQADYTALFSALAAASFVADTLVMAWSDADFTGDTQQLQQSLQLGVYSLLPLSQALLATKLATKVTVVHLTLGDLDTITPQNAAMMGFLKTLCIESTKLVALCIRIEDSNPNLQQSASLLLNELQDIRSDETQIRYRQGVRLVRKVQHLPALREQPSAAGLAMKQGGVYVITGGAGGLGFIFAKYLASSCAARVVLVGRRAPDTRTEALLLELNAAGGEAVYLAADIAKLDDVKQLMQQVKQQFGAIQGVIHAAGVLRDAFIRNKTAAEMTDVFAPKLFGLMNLDLATRDEALDWFVSFSSLAGVGGNTGQADYSYANSFMDSYIHYRDQQQRAKRAYGKSLTLNWALWAQGGMQVDEQTVKFFQQNLGITPMSTALGIHGFELALASDQAQLVVVEGQQDKFEQAWGIRPVAKALAKPAVAATVEVNNLTEQVLQCLSDEVVRFLKIDPQELDQQAILLDIGFDSIGLTTFSNTINSLFGLDTTPVLFFEYPSLREISDHLVIEFAQQVASYFSQHQLDAAPLAAVSMATARQAVTADVAVAEAAFAQHSWLPAQNPQQEQAQAPDLLGQQRFIRQPIAIVGISGVMPQSDDVEEFWAHLAAGDHMVTEIPADRWDWQQFYGDPLTMSNVSNSKWGGFMRAIDLFDPLFFGISPFEARLMDPQQRIFLQTVWSTIEDSGHAVAELSGSKTGLFVGVATNDYGNLITRSGIGIEAYTSTGNSHSVLANRISFLLNLHGPSEAIDTACSSSLVALHRAVESIHSGSSEMAIVGGVQVMVDPSAYISFGKAGMLSSDGKCKTFDKNANGYVRGEGSGAIFLKKLSAAQADGDQIYAVIRGTAENHGGRAPSLTAPNPNAQAELLIEAYTKSGLDPRSIGYIECHGTGTSLGDPIENQALKKAFQKLYRDHGFSAAVTPHCALGSVKTNIGHLETAAGISGILKTLLALKYRQIPANLHLNELNPYISLDGSPFYIQAQTHDWQALRADDGQFWPRRAGVSSFGFGGANAHIIFEEYPEQVVATQATESSPQLVVLSAKQSDRLSVYASRLLARGQQMALDLMDLAYTLQVGRDAMEYRVAFVVSSMAQLQQQLTAFIQQPELSTEIYQGVVTKVNVQNSELNAQVSALLSQRDLPQLARLWCQGAAVDWLKLYPARPRRISLPTYPFRQDKYWIDTSGVLNATVQHTQSLPTAVSSSKAVLHPLVQSNISTLYQQGYRSSFAAQDPLLKPLAAEGRCGLGPLALLEATYQAARLATASNDCSELRVGQMLWLMPAVPAGEQLALEIDLEPISKTELHLTLADPQSAQVYGRAVVHMQASPTAAVDDLNQILASLSPLAMDEDAKIWPVLSRAGLQQSALLGIQQIAVGPRQLAARFEQMATTSGLATEHDQPLWLDFQPALDALTLLLLQQDGALPMLPGVYPLVFTAVSQTQLLRPLPTDGWMMFSCDSASSQSYQLTLEWYDDAGQLCAICAGLELQARAIDQNLLLKSTDKQWLTFSEAWQPASLELPMEDWQALIAAKQKNSILVLSQQQDDYQQLSQFIADLSQLVAANQPLWPSQWLALDEHNLPDEQQMQQLLGAKQAVTTLFVYLTEPSDQTQGERYLAGIYQLIRRLMTDAALQPLQVYLCSRGDESEYSAYREGISGLLKSAMQELPAHRYRQIHFDQAGLQQHPLPAQLILEWLTDDSKGQPIFSAAQIRYCGANRYRQAPTSRTQLTVVSEQVTFKTGGTYLMVGALGDAGQLVCQQLASLYQPTLVIFSRRSASEVQDQLKAIENAGAQVVYRAVDILDQAQLTEVFQQLQQQGIQVQGVVHMARQTRDGAMINKTWAEFNQTIAVKVNGSYALDEATASMALDFYLLFSSVAAFGIRGSADYGYACAFQNAFARHRNQLVAQGQRQGRTIALCWGQWEVDGAVAPQQLPGRLKMMRQMGLDVIDATSACTLMSFALATAGDVVGFVAATDTVQAATLIGLTTASSAATAQFSDVLAAFGQDQLSKTEFIQYLQALGDDQLSAEQQAQVVAVIRQHEKKHGGGQRLLPRSPGLLSTAPFAAPISATAVKLKAAVVEPHVAQPIVVQASGTQQSVMASNHSAAVVETSVPAVYDRLARTLGQVLAIDLSQLQPDLKLMDYGLDSISAVRFASALEQELAIAVAPNWFIEYPDLTSLATHIAALLPKSQPSKPRAPKHQTPSKQVDVTTRATSLSSSGHTAVADLIRTVTVQVKPTISASSKVAPVRSGLKDEIDLRLLQVFEQVLGITPAQLQPGKNFIEYGLDSISAVQFATALEREFSIEVSPGWLAEHPTLEAFSERLTKAYLEKRNAHV